MSNQKNKQKIAIANVDINFAEDISIEMAQQKAHQIFLNIMKGVAIDTFDKKDIKD